MNLAYHEDSVVKESGRSTFAGKIRQPPHSATDSASGGKSKLRLRLIARLRLSVSSLTDCEPPLQPEPLTTEQQAKKMLARVVAKFLLTWVGFLGILVCLALLTDINWARPFMQNALHDTMHRNVRLGRLQWSFGLNGLAVATEKMIITELDDKPFLTADHSEIGIAVAPLFKKQVLIRHLQFQKPEIYAVRTPSGKWNFTDLLRGPDIRFISCENGRFHVIDNKMVNGKPAWKPLDLTEVNVKFNYPRQRKKTPVFISFKIPRKDYSTKMELIGLVLEKTKRWQDMPSQFVFKVDKVYPADLSDFVAAVVPALTTIESAADASTGTSISASSSASASTSTNTKTNTKTAANATAGTNASTTARVSTTTNASTNAKATANTTAKATADQSLAEAGGVDMSQLKSLISPGTLKGVFSLSIACKGALTSGLMAHITAGADNFAVTAPALGKISTPHVVTTCRVYLDEHRFKWNELNLKFGNLVLTSQGELDDWKEKKRHYVADIGGKIEDIKAAAKMVSQQDKLPGLKESEQWSGKADVQVHLLGGNGETKCETNLKVEDVLAKSLLEKLPPEAQPIMTVFSFKKDAKLKGALKIVPGQRIDVKNVALPLSVGIINAVGGIDLQKNTTKFTFSGTSLALNPVQDALDAKLHDNKAAAELPRGAKLRLDGNFDIAGEFASVPKKEQSSGEITLKNAQVVLSDHSLNMKRTSGNISWKDGMVHFKNVAGDLDDGTFTLNGSCGTAANSRIDMNLTAKHAQLEELETVLRILKVRLPILTEQQLYGRVKDLTLILSGSPKQPEIYLSAIPDDVYYQPPGLTRPLRARGGTITYDKDNLTLSELQLAIKNDKVYLTVDIGDVSKTAVVKRVLVKTSGTELVDVNYYLSSVLMPPPLKRVYASFLSQYKLSAIHGRTSADLTCVINGSNVDLEGTCTFSNVGARVAKQFPVERTSGTVTVSGDQLVLQNLSGMIHESKVGIDGRVSNYKDKNAVLAVQVNATLNPRELTELLPALSDDRQRKFQLRATGALDLQAGLRGTSSKNHIWFVLKADPHDGLNLTSPLGNVYQPDGQSFALQGAADLDQAGANLTKLRVAIGESAVIGSGTIKYARLSAPAGTDIDDVPIDYMNTELDLKVKTEKPTDIGTLLSLLDKTVVRSELHGTVDGALNLQGTLSQPRPSGSVTFDKLTITKANLHDLSGSVSLARTASESHQSGKIKIGSFKFKNLVVKDLSSDIALNTARGEQVMSFTSGKALAAGGNVSFNGEYNTTVHKLALNMALEKVKAATIADEVLEQSGEISGLTDVTLQLSTTCDNYNTAMSNLSGNGQLVLHNGAITRFGQLQAKLTQANLLHQGLFGFNLNNLLQSVYPVRTGNFKELSGKYSMDRGLLSFTELRYDGDDMRLWGTGKMNFSLGTVAVEIAGKIPRVTSSVLKGPVGDVSRYMTFQKMMDVVSMHRLEALPSLPVLGDIAGDKPRTFSFKVAAPLADPKLVALSIEKSFHWLAPKPGASAHPVPGLEPTIGL